VSVDLSIRNAASGETISPVSASGVTSTAATAVGVPAAIVPAVSSTGSATASLPKPSCVTKASAALTSSSRFSRRTIPPVAAISNDATDWSANSMTTPRIATTTITSGSVIPVSSRSRRIRAITGPPPRS